MVQREDVGRILRMEAQQMRKKGKSSLILVELFVTLLFFAVTAMITVQLFVAANRRSTANLQEQHALIIAQDWVELLGGEEEPAVFLMHEGFAQEEDARFVRSAGAEELMIIADIEEGQHSRAGQLVSVKISVCASSENPGERGEVLAALPCISYIPDIAVREVIP